MRIRLFFGFALAVLLAAPHSVAQTSSPSKSSPKAARKKAPTKKKPAAKTRNLQRAQRLKQTFVESSDLKPMAAQLLETRLPAAFQGVEAYAQKHAGSAAGTLAWMVLGYAYLQDGQGHKAVPPLLRAQQRGGDLGDYIDLFLAQAYQANGSPADVIATLRGFDTKHPDSLLRTEAALMHATALLATGSPRSAASLLEPHRSPVRAEVELATARAYSAAGELARAAQAYRTVYYTLPASYFADVAYSELQAMSAKQSVPSASYQQRRTRAELLYQGRQYQASADEFRALLTDAPSSELRRLQVAYGTALYKAGRGKDARLVLEQVPEQADEINAQRLFYLAELVKDDQKRWAQTINRLRDSAPASPWLAEALLAAGNRFLLQKNHENALRFYQETYSRIPNGKYAAYTHWKTAWLAFRLGRRDDAKRLFEEQITNYPESAEVSSALYWRGRLAEEDRDLPRARAYYQKLIDRYRWFYYAELARERMQALREGPGGEDPVLASVAPLQPPEVSLAVPSDNVRAQKALVLQNAALYDFAVKELQAADGTSRWATAEIARMHQESGRTYRALQVVKRALSGYYSYDFGHLPRFFWEALFPRPYWTEVRKYSMQNGLDPFLVTALIRQESEFNPDAVSRANAIGLMQVLPATGKKVARQLKLQGFTPAQLTVPNVNLQVGAAYFRQMLDDYDGQVEYALAAYNAGSDRVDDWRKAGKYRDIHEFVESIPFTETREYVQAIKRNVGVYRRLYGTP